ncbi:MAG: MFS transporter [Candidatus Doudnabacteria bacterium]
MLFNFHLPHYFASKVRAQIEHLYASMAIGNLAQAMIAIFEPIFLYQVVGLTIEQVLLFTAALYSLYILLIIYGAKVASRFGFAHAIFFSIPFQILFWVALVGAQYNITFLIIAPVMLAIQKSLFWPAFNASMAKYANHKQIGREFSAMYALMSVMQILGPLFGGFLAIFFGPSFVFVIGSIIYLASALPLLWSDKHLHPHQYKFKQTWDLYKKYTARFCGYLGYGEELLALTIWPIFIFVNVKTYQDVGALVTVATLVATVLALYMGIYIDRHSKRGSLRFGNGFYFLSWLVKIPLISTLGLFLADSFSRTAKSTVSIPLTTLTLERAEVTDVLAYSVGFEQALSVGKLAASLLGIIVFALTGSFIALFILAALFCLFYFLI